MSLRVMTLVGTRPELIRLSLTIKELDRHTDHVLVHTGQNYDHELNGVFFSDLDLRAPDTVLDAAGDTPLDTVGRILAKSYEVMSQTRPDALLVLGDTNSCLSLYSAKRLRIPTFHMEAGNRCFDERVPEEINRRLIDHIADVNLPYSRHARDLLLLEGRPADRTIVTGSPMFEVLAAYREKIRESPILGSLGLTPGGFFLVSVHREENVDEPARLQMFLALLQRLHGAYGLPVVVSTHPRTAARLEAAGGQATDLGDQIRFLRPFGFTSYVNLQMNARAVLSDSGTITEEASILGLPAVNLRETHERHEGMEEAAVPMAGLDPDCVLLSLRMVLDHHARQGPGSASVPLDYQVPDVSRKVVSIIHSYVPYVRRTVWAAGWSPSARPDFSFRPEKP